MTSSSCIHRLRRLSVQNVELPGSRNAYVWTTWLELLSFIWTMLSFSSENNPLLIDFPNPVEPLWSVTRSAFWICRMSGCLLEHTEQVRSRLQSLFMWPFAKQPKQTPFFFNISTRSSCVLESNYSHEVKACVPLQITQELTTLDLLLADCWLSLIEGAEVLVTEVTKLSLLLRESLESDVGLGCKSLFVGSGCWRSPKWGSCMILDCFSMKATRSEKVALVFLCSKMSNALDRHLSLNLIGSFETRSLRLEGKLKFLHILQTLRQVAACL